MGIEEYVSFEEAEAHTGIPKHTLGRVKEDYLPYLAKYIKNKQFNLNQYIKDTQEIQELRHKAHCIYYAVMDVYETEEELAKELSKMCGRSNKQWIIFLDRDLFAIQKNAVMLNWYEVKMVDIVYEVVIDLDKAGALYWEDYFY